MRIIAWIRRQDYLRRFRKRHPDRSGTPETVYFLHIGKTGGTFLKGYIRSPSCFAKEGALIVPFGHNITHRHLPRGSRYIIATRDPVSRFVSGFGSRQRKGQPTTYKEWSKEESRAFNAFASENTLAEALTSNDPKLRREAESAMRAIKHVKDPQTNWVSDRGRLLEDLRAGRVYWIRQEALQEDAIAVFEAIGCPLRADVIRDMKPVHARPGPPPTLSDAGIDNIRNHYSGDYELLDLLAREYRGPSRL